MICNNGSVKILDFGGARDYIFSNEKSLSIMLKPGYAPEEQYRTHGNQGPWTDVYALCATMYRCITGFVPPESLERAYQESLPPIRSISPDCPPAAASAIEKGMSIYPEDRFQSMQELYSALYESSQSFSDAPEPQKRSKRKGLKIFLVICLFVIAFILVMYLTHDQVLTINISAKTETTGFISQADIRS